MTFDSKYHVCGDTFHDAENILIHADDFARMDRSELQKRIEYTFANDTSICVYSNGQHHLYSPGEQFGVVDDLYAFHAIQSGKLPCNV